MSNETPQIQAPSGASQQNTAGSCLGITLRLITAVVLGILLALMIFYGVPSLYQWIVMPYETRLARLEAAQRRQADETQRFSTRLDDFQSRINGLELQNDISKQSLDELQSLLDELERTQEASDHALQAAQTSSDERLAEVASSVEAVMQSLEGLDGKLAGFEATISETRGNLREVAERLTGEDAPVAALRRELRLVMAMELLTRSRLFLLQDNQGLAHNDIQAARSLLANLQRRVPARQVTALQAILDNLDAALENLPEWPFLAGENLEIAWRLLQQGLPDELPLPTASPAENATATPVPTRSP